MAQRIVRYFCDRPSQPIFVIWFVVSLFVVSLSRSVVVDPYTVVCAKVAQAKNKTLNRQLFDISKKLEGRFLQDRAILSRSTT